MAAATGTGVYPISVRNDDGKLSNMMPLTVVDPVANDGGPGDDGGPIGGDPGSGAGGIEAQGCGCDAVPGGSLAWGLVLSFFACRRRGRR